MPIYEYLCAACGFQQEYLQKMNAAPLTDCPECGKPSFSKMMSAAGFQLKGSGWYATDFKHGVKPKSKPDDQAATKLEGQPAAKAGDQPTAKANDKPASEAPAKNSDATVSTAKTGADTSAVS